MDLIIFDKDGVLLDLTQTWLPVARDITHYISELTDHEVPASVFQDIIGIDEASGKIDPDGLFAAGSFLDQQAAFAVRRPSLAPLFSTEAFGARIKAIVDINAARPPAPLGDIATSLTRLADMGYQMAVLTNDSEASARGSLSALSVSSFFTHIIGYDSGYGGKPAPEGFLAICEGCGVSADKTIMVGDTGADRAVAKAAGAGRFIGISQTYPKPTKALEGVRDILPSIEGLAAQIGPKTD
ncbi:MAG: HAD family hydrolase [Candidatus Puniceispirillaceae bacterium]